MTKLYGLTEFEKMCRRDGAEPSREGSTLVATFPKGSNHTVNNSRMNRLGSKVQLLDPITGEFVETVSVEIRIAKKN